MLYYFLRSFAVFLCKVLFRIQVEGKGNIPKKGGFILASNHLSYLDPIILGVACPRKLTFMAKEELFSIPVFSSLIRRLGAFPIKRYRADISAFKEAFKMVKRGLPLVIFPEGRRSPTGDLLNPLKGVGFLVDYLRVPVVPALIRGTDKVLPVNKKFIHPKKIWVYFGEPIFIERRKPSDYLQIAQQVMDEIRRLGCNYQ